MALLGGAVAAGSHVTKAGTRVAANASPEPFSNWALSLAEDVFVVGLGLVTLKFPLLALGISAVVLLRWWCSPRAGSGAGCGGRRPARPA